MKDDPLKPLLKSLLSFEHLFNLSYDYADENWYEEYSPRQTKPPWSQLEDWEGRYSWNSQAPSEGFLKVVEAIYESGDKRAVEPLKEAGFEVYAFKLLGDVDGLISCLGKDHYTSWLAINILVDIGDIKAVKPIIELDPSQLPIMQDKDDYWCGEDEYDRQQALVKIAEKNIKGKEKDNIIKFLKSDDPGMVRMGASMLTGVLEE
jgi:HEAT repeat protein